MVTTFPYFNPLNYPDLFLKKNEDKRLRKGHLWIFSNEVDIARNPLTQFSSGDLVTIRNASGQAQGIAYVNPHTLICARLLTRKSNVKIAESFFRNRLQQALSLRERLFDKPYYRLIYAESDGLPGLVVDRFNDVLSVQITTAGMDRLKDCIITGLTDLLNPTATLLKNRHALREMEGLTEQEPELIGRLPEPLIITENQCQFQIDIINGQKTGWFYDHRSNRAQLAQLAQNQRVLDLFSYSGAWGIQAAVAGAKAVTCVDSSASALALAETNAKINHVSDKLQTINSDVFDFLKQTRDLQQHYDIVIVDPPALIKRKKDANKGLQAYLRLNRLALQVLSMNGILVSASCSQQLSRVQLHELLRSNARHLDRHLIFLASGSQGPDHPLHPAISETDYLKSFVCHVSASL